MPRITDPAFVYVPSHATDIRRTFARIRAQQKAQEPVPYWFRAAAADEAADLDRAAAWRDIDTRR